MDAVGVPGVAEAIKSWRENMDEIRKRLADIKELEVLGKYEFFKQSKIYKKLDLTCNGCNGCGSCGD